MAPPPCPPGEWAPHRACWLAWPADAELWPELELAQQAFVRMARAIGASERLEVLVQRPAGREAVAAALEGLDVRTHVVSFGDIWMRDAAPVFTRAAGQLWATGFAWSGWGGKYCYPGDAEVAETVAALSGARFHASPLRMEGGGLEHDGLGTVLTTRECALAPSRNPGAGPEDVERELAAAVGARRVVWLERGLRNDHTDGHIDNIARFVAPGRVVCMRASGADDPQREVLEEIERTLRAARDREGKPFEVVTVPSPGCVRSRSGAVLPASHLNFYVANRALVVPVYGAPEEDRALSELGALFPGREVLPVPSQVFLEEGGAVHCITQQEPA